MPSLQPERGRPLLHHRVLSPSCGRLPLSSPKTKAPSWSSAKTFALRRRAMSDRTPVGAQPLEGCCRRCAQCHPERRGDGLPQAPGSLWRNLLCSLLCIWSKISALQQRRLLQSQPATLESNFFKID